MSEPQLVVELVGGPRCGERFVVDRFSHYVTTPTTVCPRCGAIGRIHYHRTPRNGERGSVIYQIDPTETLNHTLDCATLNNPDERRPK